MADHSDDGGHEDHHDHEEGRSTAPQSAYTNRDVAVGWVVALVGLLVTFGIPILLTI
jgi:hypothetical protein